MWPDGGRDRRARVDDAADPRTLPARDRIAQRQRHAVAVAEVAHRGEAGAQRLAGVDERVVAPSAAGLSCTCSSCAATPPASEVRCTWLSMSPGSTNRSAQVDDLGARQTPPGPRRHGRCAPRPRGRHGSRGCSVRAPHDRDGRAAGRPGPVRCATVVPAARPGPRRAGRRQRTAGRIDACGNGSCAWGRWWGAQAWPDLSVRTSSPSVASGAEQVVPRHT